MADIIQQPTFASDGLSDSDIEAQRQALNAVPAQNNSAAPATNIMGPLEAPTKENAGPQESTGTKFAKSDITLQIAGGLEDGFKNVVNGGFAVGKAINEMLPANQQFDSLKGEPPLDASQSSIPHPDGTAMKFVRSAAQFLAPFGVATKAAAGIGLAGAANVGVSTLATGFFAFDPAEKNLSNVVQSVPALQNPITEFLASDGSDTALNRLKQGIEQTVTLAGADVALKHAIIPVVAAGASAAAPIIKSAAEAVGPKLSDFISTFADAVKAVKDKRDLMNQGFTEDSVPDLANVKNAAAPDTTIGEDLKNNLAIAQQNEQTQGVLNGSLNPEDISKPAAPAAEDVAAADNTDNVGDSNSSVAAAIKDPTLIGNLDTAGSDAIDSEAVNTGDAAGSANADNRIAKTTFTSDIPDTINPPVDENFMAKVPAWQEDLTSRVFGKTPAQFDTMNTLRSAGLVDDPVISDLLKFASEQTPATKLSWDETNAQALGMTLEQAQARFGTAGELTAAAATIKNNAIALAAKLTDAVNTKGLNSPEGAEALARFMQVGNLKDMASSEFGRGLNSLKHTTSVDTLFQNLKDSITSGQMEAAIKSLGGDPDKMLVFGKQLSRSKLSDIGLALHTFWTNSILSGPITHLTIFTSNLASLIMRPAERFVAAGIGNLKGAMGVLNGSDKALASEALEMYYGYFQGARDGLKSLLETGSSSKALKNIVGPEAGSKFDVSADVQRGGMLLRKAVIGRETNLTYQQFKDAGPLGMAQELMARTLTAPADAIGGIDQYFKTAAALGQKRSLAFRNATAEGLTGDAFNARINAIMTNSPIDDAERAILGNINNASAEFARETTFQKDLTSSGEALVNLRDKVPGMQYVIPFIKIPMNIIDESFLRRSPLGLASARIRGEILAGGAKGDEAIARMTIGTSIMASIAAAYQAGGVTGAGPKAAALRDKWLEQNQPWSIKVGSQWYSYNKIEPLGSLMGLGARLSEVIEHNADSKVLSPDEEQEVAFSTVGAITKYMTDKSIMTGLENILSVLEGDEGATKKFTADILGGFVPFSGALRTIKNASDGELRNTEGILDKVSAQIPGLSETLPPARNRFGDVVQASDKTTGLLLPISHTPGDVNDEKTVKINDIEDKAGVVIAKPSRIFDGIKLTLPEYDQRLQALKDFDFNGIGIKDAIINTAARPEFQALPTGVNGGQGALIKRVYSNYLKASDATFLKQNPAIAVKIEQAKMNSFTVNRQINTSTGEPQAKPEFIGDKKQ